MASACPFIACTVASTVGEDYFQMMCKACSEKIDHVLLQIRLGVRYLKDVLKMKFPELRARAAAAEAETRRREVSSPFILFTNTYPHAYPYSCAIL